MENLQEFAIRCRIVTEDGPRYVLIRAHSVDNHGFSRFEHRFQSLLYLFKISFRYLPLEYRILDVCEVATQELQKQSRPVRFDIIYCDNVDQYSPPPLECFVRFASQQMLFQLVSLDPKQILIAHFAVEVGMLYSPI